MGASWSVYVQALVDIAYAYIGLAFLHHVAYTTADMIRGHVVEWRKPCVKEKQCREEAKGRMLPEQVKEERKEKQKPQKEKKEKKEKSENDKNFKQERQESEPEKKKKEKEKEESETEKKKKEKERSETEKKKKEKEKEESEIDKKKARKDSQIERKKDTENGVSEMKPQSEGSEIRGSVGKRRVLKEKNREKDMEELKGMWKIEEVTQTGVQESRKERQVETKQAAETVREQVNNAIEQKEEEKQVTERPTCKEEVERLKKQVAESEKEKEKMRQHNEALAQQLKQKQALELQGRWQQQRLKENSRERQNHGEKGTVRMKMIEREDDRTRGRLQTTRGRGRVRTQQPSRVAHQPSRGRSPGLQNRQNSMLQNAVYRPFVGTPQRHGRSCPPPAFKNAPSTHISTQPPPGLERISKASPSHPQHAGFAHAALSRYQAQPILFYMPFRANAVMAPLSQAQTAMWVSLQSGSHGRARAASLSPRHARAHSRAHACVARGPAPARQSDSKKGVQREGQEGGQEGEGMPPGVSVEGVEGRESGPGEQADKEPGERSL